MLRNTLRILALSSPQKTSIVAVLRMRGMLTEKPFRKWAKFFRFRRIERERGRLHIAGLIECSGCLLPRSEAQLRNRRAFQATLVAGRAHTIRNCCGCRFVGIAEF